MQEGIPGSGVGRVGALFPDDSGQIDACRFGAYLDEIDQFDAAFFRISPVEAHLLDPQQRLILETSWRALEDAGLDPDRLKDSRTGVYAGISNNDYRGLILEAGENAGPSEPAASLYAVTGTSLNTAIGRVAFALGLGGPAMAVDTACSSSLVATHQAVTGLQRGDADLALAGGVNIILSGRLLEYRANAGMLSPDGQCKTFDASANGYVRGEGCGIVVLKRLADAQADGDRIWGVVRGTALNQDGASPGLTVPNGAAQERVIEAALDRAGVRPSDIDYLEAHGTGTVVGGPIEIDATAAVYGRGRGLVVSSRFRGLAPNQSRLQSTTTRPSISLEVSEVTSDQRRCMRKSDGGDAKIHSSDAGVPAAKAFVDAGRSDRKGQDRQCTEKSDGFAHMPVNPCQIHRRPGTSQQRVPARKLFFDTDDRGCNIVWLVTVEVCGNAAITALQQGHHVGIEHEGGHGPSASSTVRR